MPSARDLTSRPLRHNDAVGVTRVIAACELAASGEVLIELEDIVADWARPGFDLSGQTVGWFDAEGIVACGEVHRSRSESYVHPAACGRGIGTQLVRWSQETARRLGYARIGQTLHEDNTAAVALLTGHGYTRRYVSWVLEVPSGGEVPDVSVPDGYVLREAVPGQEDRAVFEVIEGAFGKWPDRESRDFEDWATTTVRREDFRPWHLGVAVAPDGAVAGACYASPVGDIGWVDQLAVDQAHRGRGLAQALLVHAFARCREHGTARAQLNTDSRTGALGLYEHVGMEVTQTHGHYAVDL